MTNGVVLIPSNPRPTEYGWSDQELDSNEGLDHNVALFKGMLVDWVLNYPHDPQQDININILAKVGIGITELTYFTPQMRDFWMPSWIGDLQHAFNARRNAAHREAQAAGRQTEDLLQSRIKATKCFINWRFKNHPGKLEPTYPPSFQFALNGIGPTG
ncbi:hypothetical protein BS50DRAFT_586921 [Corynespora cassiicola Philippines]|uniref:Uncharacterized protein n=1 Tax=Corynespora cassiicola Philippines TaxID=1448308 RepID=A0A2T2NQE3_CORCC|nr:hypothetical protein BS50DRAFT_586921 [Corynespora cassiicola Philippines]